MPARSPDLVTRPYAAEHGFVLGRHGDGGAARQRLGRVAEAAVQARAVPVLLLSAP